MTDRHPSRVGERGWLRWVTALQGSRLAEWREKWTREGFCTDPADRVAAARAIRAMYESADLRAPRIVWCGSPLSLSITLSLMALPKALEAWSRYSVGRGATLHVAPSVRASVDDSLELSLSPSSDGLDPLRDFDLTPVTHAVRDSVGLEMVRGLKDAIEPWVFHAVDGGLDMRRSFISVRRWVWYAAREALENVFRSLEARDEHAFRAGFSESNRRRGWMTRDWEREFLFGQHDVDWLAFVHYFTDICGWGEQSKSSALAALRALAGSAGWALPRTRICWVSERPILVLRDLAGRLHCANGPALVYPDGWDLYFWHGVPVRAGWLARAEFLEPRFVLTWPQPEQRSALAEIAGGWQVVIARLPNRIVDEDADPSIGTLLECALPEGTARFLRVVCGTGRTFALPVPRGCETARQANAWTYGLAATEYAPEVRT